MTKTDLIAHLESEGFETDCGNAGGLKIYKKESSPYSIYIWIYIWDNATKFAQYADLLVEVREIYWTKGRVINVARNKIILSKTLSEIEIKNGKLFAKKKQFPIYK